MFVVAIFGVFVEVTVAREFVSATIARALIVGTFVYLFVLVRLAREYVAAAPPDESVEKNNNVKNLIWRKLKVFEYFFVFASQRTRFRGGTIRSLASRFYSR